MKQASELTVQQAARRLGVTLKYVRDLLYEQRLPGAYKRERVWRIPLAAVEAQMRIRESHNGQQ